MGPTDAALLIAGAHAPPAPPRRPGGAAARPTAGLPAITTDLA
jgi:hypothetical protein